MYEFHGWVKLAESASEVDEGAFDEKCKKLRRFLDSLNWSSGSADLLLMNGVHILTLNAVPNRRRSEASQLNELILLLTQEFKGAYGIIYEYDEQTATVEGRGVFSVKVIKRGRCEIALDPFLSPVVPVVENP